MAPYPPARASLPATRLRRSAEAITKKVEVWDDEDPSEVLRPRAARQGGWEERLALAVIIQAVADAEKENLVNGLLAGDVPGARRFLCGLDEDGGATLRFWCEVVGVRVERIIEYASLRGWGPAGWRPPAEMTLGRCEVLMPVRPTRERVSWWYRHGRVNVTGNL